MTIAGFIAIALLLGYLVVPIGLLKKNKGGGVRDEKRN